MEGYELVLEVSDTRPAIPAYTPSNRPAPSTNRATTSSRRQEAPVTVHDSDSEESDDDDDDADDYDDYGDAFEEPEPSSFGRRNQECLSTRSHRAFIQKPNEGFIFSLKSLVQTNTDDWVVATTELQVEFRRRFGNKGPQFFIGRCGLPNSNDLFYLTLFL